MEKYFKSWLTFAFVSGILLTLGYKDFYPELERRFRRRRRENLQLSTPVASSKLGEGIALQDATDEAFEAIAEPEILVGIEGCIGNTPLFKIKSLSDATGCDILAKAEVTTQELKLLRELKPLTRLFCSF